jgi:hypothetical protein
VSTIGYSGKAVWEKLGLKPGLRVALLGQDVDYTGLVGMDFEVVTTLPAEADLVHLLWLNELC